MNKQTREYKGFKIIGDVISRNGKYKGAKNIKIYKDGVDTNLKPKTFKDAESLINIMEPNNVQ